MEESAVHVSFTRHERVKRFVGACPTCKRRRTIVATFQEWYGWTQTCLGCGDRWTDGEMHERPFMPRWRQNNIRDAREMWRKNGKRP